MRRYLFFWLMVLNVQAQQVVEILNAQIETKGYSIAKVDLVKEANIGNTQLITGSKSILLTDNAAEKIAALFAQNKNERKIILKIDKMVFNETEKPKGQITGDFLCRLEFHYQKINGSTQKLTGYTFTSNYMRPTVQTAQRADLLAKGLQKGMVFFNDWYAKNKENHTAFASKVQLRLEEKPLNHADTILWRGTNTLEWGHFRGAPKNDSKFAAQIFSSFGYEATTRKETGAIGVVVKSWAYMVPNMSWVKSIAKDPYTLDHEQLHFDITQLWLLKFRGQLKTLTLDIEQPLWKINYEYLEFYRKLHTMQTAYDSETNHGIEKDQQAAWAKKVRTELMALKADQNGQ